MKFRKRITITAHRSISQSAEERVTADVVKQGDELYFSDEADEDEKGKEKGYVYRPL